VSSSHLRRLSQGPSITKKNDDFFFVNFGTHNNKIHTIYKQTCVFVLIFFMFLFCFISKQQQQKNRHFIYDLSMLCLDLGLPVYVMLFYAMTISGIRTHYLRCLPVSTIHPLKEPLVLPLEESGRFQAIRSPVVLTRQS
jgi:hypothetical protein